MGAVHKSVNWRWVFILVLFYIGDIVFMGVCALILNLSSMVFVIFLVFLVVDYGSV